jgi:hypothetical protein
VDEPVSKHGGQTGILDRLAPYLNASQIRSGTLAYSFGCGKAIIAPPYWHAEELLSNGGGILVPFRDSQAIVREVLALLKDDERRNAMRQKTYLLGRTMIWNKVAQRFRTSCWQAWQSRQADFAPWPEVLREEPKQNSEQEHGSDACLMSVR